MLPSSRIKYWLITTNSSPNRASKSSQKPVDRRSATRPAFAALILALALILAGCAGGSNEGGGSNETGAEPAEATASEITATAVPEITVGAEPSEASPPTPSRTFDLQGHRGARGLRPENTLPAFETALDLMVDTLEFDLHLSADDVVIVWHDPVIDSDKCTFDAAPTPIRELAATQITEIRCDQNPDPGRFPEQVAEPGVVAGSDYTLATLDDVFAFVETYANSAEKTDAQRANAATVRFNIETKRKLDDPAAIGDSFDGETAGTFELAVIQTVVSAGVIDRVTIQSFDHRSLWAVQAEDPTISLAALTSRGDIPDFAALKSQGAAIWSPDYRSVSPSTLEAAHDAGLLVIPWTVNDPTDMAHLVELGVDGIITDRPDLAPPP